MDGNGSRSVFLNKMDFVVIFFKIFFILSESVINELLAA